MKKLLLSLLVVLSLPMAALAADPKLPALEARAAAVGAPNYADWCKGSGSWGAGYEGFVDFMDNYLTPENRTKVLDAKAYSASTIYSVLPHGGDQDYAEWLVVNPWK